MSVLDNPIFTDPDKARQHLEAMRWPNGPVCPHCGNSDPDAIRALKGKAHRPGVYQCNECREQFTVTVGTVFERSKIPLNKWLLATHLMTASKKGMSAHQMHRMLGLTYKSAWFMCHRIREAMRDDVKSSGPLGGSGKVIEVDETYLGTVENPRTVTTSGRPFTKSGMPSWLYNCENLAEFERQMAICFRQIEFADRAIRQALGFEWIEPQLP